MSAQITRPSRLARAYARARVATRRFGRREEGATVVEFAVLAVPFFLLLFAILELALIFYMNSALDNATANASREVRVGQLQGKYSSAKEQLTEFRSIVCDGMSAFPGCQQRLRVTMKVSSTGDFISSVTNPTKDNELDCSGPREVVILRIRYTFNLILPGNVTQLDNSGTGANTHDIATTTAFRNEPFPSGAGSTCGTATEDNPTT